MKKKIIPIVSITIAAILSLVLVISMIRLNLKISSESSSAITDQTNGSLELKSLSTEQIQQYIDAVKNHVCDDGHTVAEVLEYTHKATNGVFIPGKYIVQQIDPQRLYVSNEYYIKPNTKEGDQYSVDWVISNDGKDISLTPGSQDVQSGELFYAMYTNQYLANAGELHNKKMLTDTNFLSIIPAQGFRTGVKGLIDHFKIKISLVNFSYVAPTSDSDNSQTIKDIRQVEGSHMEIYFDLPVPSNQKNMRDAFKELRAEWVKKPGEKEFKPVNPWAEHMTNDGVNLRITPPLYPNYYDIEEAVSDVQSSSNEDISVKTSGIPRPEQIVTFKENTFACITKEDYTNAGKHLALGEMTKFNGMFNDSTCIMILPTEKYKILSVDGGFMGSYVEFVNIYSDASSGLWTAMDYVNR